MTNKTKANIEFTSDLSILKDADIICTSTNSESPLFYKKHLKKGTHINAIGSLKPEMQELDPEIINSSRVYYDDKEACLNKNGDFLKAIEDPRNFNDNIIGEIGEYMLNKIEGRTSSEEVNIFKSVGTAIQEFVVENRIYNKSLAEKFGEEMRLYE